ncbi:hypothetical protein ACU4GD_41375 [Cupriavidus basilensis]
MMFAQGGWPAGASRDRRFRVEASGPDALARRLRGGNLQKFIVGREIETAPRC